MTDRADHRRGPRPLRGSRPLHGRRAARGGVAARRAARGRPRGVGRDALGAAAVGAVARAARDARRRGERAGARRAAAGGDRRRVAALSLALEASGRARPAALAVPAAGDPERARRAARRRRRVTLLICAHYDAPRGGLITRDGPRRLAARLRRRLGGHAPGRGRGSRWRSRRSRCAPGCARSGSRAVARRSRSSCRRSCCSCALAAAGDVAVSPISPGAGDNAAGVGVALALHAELTRNPPDALVPALLLYGAGEGGPPAVRAHLRREKLERERVVVLELGPCGAGAPAYAPPTRSCAPPAGSPPTRSTVPRARRCGARARRAARGRRLPAAWIGALDADRDRPALAPAVGHARAPRPRPERGRARLRARLRRRARRGARYVSPAYQAPKESANSPAPGSARCGRPARRSGASAPTRTGWCRAPSTGPTWERTRARAAAASSWLGSAAISSSTTAPVPASPCSVPIASAWRGVRTWRWRWSSPPRRRAGGGGRRRRCA